MRSIRGELTQPPDPEREYNSLLQNISQFLNLTHPIEVQGLQSAISHVLLSSSIFHNDLNRLVKLCDSVGIQILDIFYAVKLTKLFLLSFYR